MRGGLSIPVNNDKQPLPPKRRAERPIALRGLPKRRFPNALRGSPKIIHGIYVDDEFVDEPQSSPGFWVDVNHVGDKPPRWAYVEGSVMRAGDAGQEARMYLGDADQKTLMRYLGYPSIPMEKPSEGPSEADRKRVSACDRQPRYAAVGGGVVGGGGGGALLFSNLGYFCNKITRENAATFREKILPQIPITPDRGGEINILHIVTAPLQYVKGERPRNNRLEVLSDGISTASDALRHVFSGEFGYAPRPPNDPTARRVRVYHLHLYDPEKETTIASGEYVPSVMSTEEAIINTFKLSAWDPSRPGEDVLHLLGWNVATEQYTSDPAAKQMQLRDLMVLNDINVVFCAGGETHWLRRRLAETGCLDPNISAFIHMKDQIVWSGFSAGAIALGATTRLCAAKNFSTVTNPDRAYPHRDYDDVSVLGTGVTPCFEVSENEPLPTVPPPDCDYSALGVLKYTVFPHYGLEIEALIAEQGRDNVLRISETTCFAINMLDSPIALKNKPFSIDELAAGRGTTTSLPGVVFNAEVNDRIYDKIYLKGLLAKSKEIRDYIETGDLFQSVPSLDMYQRLLRALGTKIDADAMGKWNDFAEGMSEKVESIKVDLRDGMEISEISEISGITEMSELSDYAELVDALTDVKGAIEKLVDLRLEVSARLIEIDRREDECRAQFKLELEKKIEGMSTGITREGVVMEIEVDYCNRCYNGVAAALDNEVVIDWFSGFSVNGVRVLDWSLLEDESGDPEDGPRLRLALYDTEDDCQLYYPHDQIYKTWRHSIENITLIINKALQSAEVPRSGGASSKGGRPVAMLVAAAAAGMALINALLS